MIHRNKNFALGADTSAVQDGDTLIRCNCIQGRKNTAIFDGVTGLTFEQCNLLNAVPPADATIIGGLVIQRLFCSNLHPDWVDNGLLDPEPENCPHATWIEPVTVDGLTVADGYYEYDEIWIGHVEYRHIESGKIVDGKAGA